MKSTYHIKMKNLEIRIWVFVSGIGIYLDSDLPTIYLRDQNLFYTSWHNAFLFSCQPNLPSWIFPYSLSCALTVEKRMTALATETIITSYHLVPQISNDLNRRQFWWILLWTVNLVLQQLMRVKFSRRKVTWCVRKQTHLKAQTFVERIIIFLLRQLRSKSLLLQLLLEAILTKDRKVLPSKVSLEFSHRNRLRVTSFLKSSLLSVFEFETLVSIVWSWLFSSVCKMNKSQGPEIKTASCNCRPANHPIQLRVWSPSRCIEEQISSRRNLTIRREILFSSNQTYPSRWERENSPNSLCQRQFAQLSSLTESTQQSPPTHNPGLPWGLEPTTASSTAAVQTDRTDNETATTRTNEHSKHMTTRNKEEINSASSSMIYLIHVVLWNLLVDPLGKRALDLKDAFSSSFPHDAIRTRRKPKELLMDAQPCVIHWKRFCLLRHPKLLKPLLLVLQPDRQFL